MTTNDPTRFQKFDWPQNKQPIQQKVALSGVGKFVLTPGHSAGSVNGTYFAIEILNSNLWCFVGHLLTHRARAIFPRFLLWELSSIPRQSTRTLKYPVKVETTKEEYRFPPQLAVVCRGKRFLRVLSSQSCGQWPQGGVEHFGEHIVTYISGTKHENKDSSTCKN